jgi:Bacterial capsule synthesis protein PGA_cap
MYLADQLPVPWKAIRSIEALQLSRPRFWVPSEPWARGTLKADVRIVIGGDLRPDGTLSGQPLGHLAEVTANADICTANLEIPLSKKNVIGANKDLGTASHSSAELLSKAGWSVLNVANNHSLDLATAGLTETLEHLRNARVTECGIERLQSQPQQLATRNCNGLNVGFLGYCDDHRCFDIEPAWPRLAHADPVNMAVEVRKAKAHVDILIVHVHWGYEFSLHPLLQHRNCARQLIDSGADIVVCHHAHVPMGVERWAHGLIAYGLGNTCFPEIPGSTDGHPWTRVSFLLEVGARAAGICDFAMHPFRICASGEIEAPGASTARRLRAALSVMSRRIHDTVLLARLERCRLVYEAIGLTGLIADRHELTGELVRRLRLPRQRLLIQNAPLGSEIRALVDELSSVANSDESFMPDAALASCSRGINTQLRKLYDWRSAVRSRIP